MPAISLDNVTGNGVGGNGGRSERREEESSRTGLKLLFNRLSHCRRQSAGGQRVAESNLSPDCQLTTELNRLSRERSRRYCSATARINGEKTKLYLRKV